MFYFECLWMMSCYLRGIQWLYNGWGDQSHGVGAIGLVLIFAILKQWNCSNKVKCRILFLIYPTTGSILFSGRGSVPIYPGDSNRRIGRKNENDNPVRMWWYICSSIITLIFGFFMTLGRHSGFRHVPGETRTTLQKGCFDVVVSHGNQGIKWENGNFLIWGQIIVLNLVCSMFFINKGTISWLTF